MVMLLLLLLLLLRCGDESEYGPSSQPASPAA
jgi:hypothetical protein